MRIAIAFVVFVVLLKGIEPYGPRPGGFFKSSSYRSYGFDSDSDSDSESDFYTDSDSDDDYDDNIFVPNGRTSFIRGVSPKKTIVFENNIVNGRRVPNYTITKGFNTPPRVVKSQQTKVVKNAKKPVKANKNIKTKTAKKVNSNDSDGKSYNFSGMDITCNNFSGMNPYWKGKKFYINDVEIKNFKRSDKLKIVGNKVFVNNKFKCYI